MVANRAVKVTASDLRKGGLLLESTRGQKTEFNAFTVQVPFKKFPVTINLKHPSVMHYEHT